MKTAALNLKKIPEEELEASSSFVPHNEIQRSALRLPNIEPSSVTPLRGKS